MGFKYEVETFFYEAGRRWGKDYQGNSRIKAEFYLWRAQRRNPGRAYRLVVR